jgi:spore maturation protein CgeB
LPPLTVRKIRENGVPTAMWIEHVADRLEGETIALAREHDFFFTTVADTVPLYKSEGVRNVFHLMQGFQPEAYFPKGIPPAYADGDHVLFTGRIDAHYEYRASILKGVLRTGAALKWYGERVPLTFRTLGFHLRYRDVLACHQGGKVFLEDFAHAVSRARIVLALHKCRNLRMGFSNRIWMILGCGGFYLGERVVGQEEIFRTGVDMETFSSPGEMMEKIKYYWDKPEERRRIAAAGQAKVISHHTYAHRFREMFQLIAHERQPFALP